MIGPTYSRTLPANPSAKRWQVCWIWLSCCACFSDRRSSPVTLDHVPQPETSEATRISVSSRRNVFKDRQSGGFLPETLIQKRRRNADHMARCAGANASGTASQVAR